MTFERVETIRIYRCDHPACSREARAGSDELLGHWRKTGESNSNGTYLVWHWCPEHAPNWSDEVEP